MSRSNLHLQGARRVFCAVSLLHLSLLLPSIILVGCGGSGDGRPILPADMPLHLEEHLDAATITGSVPPTDIPEPVEWRFDEPQPDWKPLELEMPGLEAVHPTPTDDALRLPLNERNLIPDTPEMVGVIYVALPNWAVEDWAHVEIRARTEDPVRTITLAFNYTEENQAQVGVPLQYIGESVPVVTDGTIQTYRLPLETEAGPWEGLWTHLAVGFQGVPDTDSLSLDILSIRVVPVEALYGGVEAGSPQRVEWHFDEPQPEWKPVEPIDHRWEAVRPSRVDDGLRLPLNTRNPSSSADLARLIGSICINLPDWDLEDWAYVEIRARTQDPMRLVGLSFNYDEADPYGGTFPFHSNGNRAFLVTDGSVQTYRLPLDWPGMRHWEGPWTHLGIWFSGQDGEEAVAMDLLSVRVIPKEAEYTHAAVGVREVPVGRRIRRAVYTHAPSRIEYRLQVPQGGRLDVGLGVLREEIPVTFRVEARPRGGDRSVLFEEAFTDRDAWGQRSVDLSTYTGQTVTVALETDAGSAGTVAFWSAPTVSAAPPVTETPNVVFYVIDGAGAEYMSLYGYNRSTTPNIDRLAAEGAVFERAYSNSSWTRPSTASFMTSLHHSVLGGHRSGSNVIPEEVLTMAQHFHRSGYQTGVFTPNPNAGKISGLDREVDVFQESWDDFTYGQRGHWREGSRYLHDAFWTWREAYPGEPYWVHFQPVDIHGDFPAAPPFSGLFISPDQANTWMEWRERRGQWQKENRRGGLFSEVWEGSGIDRVDFFTVGQGLYDEAMAYNDHQIGRLIQRLEAEGEWENTLLILAADHSIDAAFTDMAAAIQDSLPPAWSSTMLRPSITRIPLVFVWPGHIPAGQRFSEPVVSMVDVLPTVLDLVGLPLPEVMQGQSLAPLLLGEGEVESRPVIFDEFVYDDEADELRGTLEVIDGRWGASLEINYWPPQEDPEENAKWRRPVPLLLFDLWNDPYCLNSIHEERPDLVEKYTAFLEEQWEAHLALGQLFTPSEAVPLTPEQLEALRALGYIR